MKRPAWKLVLPALGAALVVTIIAFLVLTRPRPAFVGVDAVRLDGEVGDPGRGRLVFATADCASCHASPGQRDKRRLGGGLELTTPYGTMRAPNISQDERDGIGRWRTSDLANALISGVSPEGEHYYPVFPYTSFTHMQRQDVVDLMAYLRTLPSVAERPPGHRLVPPFNLRRSIGLWKLIYLDEGPLPATPSSEVALQRGRYLVEGPSHCAECHSSRNLLGAIEEDTRFAGGRDPEGTGFVPNITPTGIGSWSREELVQALRRGGTPDNRTLGSSMAGVVKNLEQLPGEDVEAIATYIRSLHARPTAKP